jgi:hypothetical protein
MRTWCLLVVLVIACDRGGDKPATGSAGSAVAPPPAPAGVAVFVDDKQVAVVSPDQVAQWPRLDTLVPVAARRLGQWQDVTLKGKSAQPPVVHAPSATYPDLVPALFPGDSGPAFGMFDPVELAKHGKPALREDGLHELRIALSQGSGRGEHEQGQGGGNDPTKLVVTIKTPAGTTTIDGTKLLAIPRDNVPGTSDGKGWALQTILDAGGVKKFDKLVLSSVSGTNLNIDKSAFSKTSIPFVKLNRQGALRLRIYTKQGDGWQPSGGDLRDFVGIEVLK